MVSLAMINERFLDDTCNAPSAFVFLGCLIFHLRTIGSLTATPGLPDMQTTTNMTKHN
jgi:hypothetical protein